MSMPPQFQKPKPMVQTLELPKPHSPRQALLMQAFVTPGLVEVWSPCGTKFGKTMGVGAGMSLAAWVKRSRVFRWVAPIYPQAKIGMEYHRTLLPKPEQDFYDLNRSQLILTLNHNQTRIEYRSGQHPENLEGEAVTGGYVLDEASKMVQQVYDSAKTTLTVTRAPMVVISTPKGKNWFYTKCMEAKEEMNWALAKGLPPTKIFMTAPSTANPFVTQAAIEDLKRSLPNRLFRQYVLAEFLDDGSCFLGFRDCYYTDPIEIYEAKQLWVAPQAKGSTVVIGADWAKTEDYTVFMAADIKTRRIVGFERFNRMKYTQAVKELARFAKNFESVEMVYHDKTGVGQALDDLLGYTNLAFHGVTFTSATKAGMVNNLMTTIEARMIELPRWNVLDQEMESFEMRTNRIGNITYSAPDGGHDDTVVALMLCCKALEYHSDRGYNVLFANEIEDDATMSGLEAYYNDLTSDDDED